MALAGGEAAFVGEGGEAVVVADGGAEEEVALRAQFGGHVGEGLEGEVDAVFLPVVRALQDEAGAGGKGEPFEEARAALAGLLFGFRRIPVGGEPWRQREEALLRQPEAVLEEVVLLSGEIADAGGARRQIELLAQGVAEACGGREPGGEALGE